MKKTTKLSILSVLLSIVFLACSSNNSDDYEPPNEEEESLNLDQTQMAPDSLNSVTSKTKDLDN